MKHIKKLVCAGVLVTLGFNTRADVIYDNFGIQNGYSFTMGNGQEIGNQILIAPSLWTLTNFSIEYYTPNATLSSSIGIDVRFYENTTGAVTNGFISPNATPFYDSGWFYGLAGGGYQMVTYGIPDLYSGALPGSINLPSGFLMPGDFTFSVIFTNISNEISLPLAWNTPGHSYGDYWLNDGTGIWTLRSTNVADANLVVDFAGTPEPSTLGLAALGGAVLLGVNKLRRKR